MQWLFLKGAGVINRGSGFALLGVPVVCVLIGWAIWVGSSREGG